MAQYINLLYVLILMSMAITSHAERLFDPTKPPFALMNPEAVAQEVENSPAEPVLQSVTLGSHHKSAMINGDVVQLGGQYQQFKLVSLSSNKAVLQSSNGAQKVLQLSFSINKQIASSSDEEERSQNK